MSRLRTESLLSVSHFALMAAAPRAVRRLERVEGAMLWGWHRALSAAPVRGRPKRSVRVSSSK